MTVPPQFTQDWSGNRTDWPELLAGFAGKPGLRFLEVGCYEGHTTLWLLENILTHESSRITVIDVFSATQEFAELGIHPANRETFERNIGRHAGKVGIMPGESSRALRYFSDPEFDFAFIDGSHRAADVLSDAVLVWPLLKPGALMVFDDYEWGDGRGQYETPKAAVDAFLSVYGDQLKVKHRGYQVAVKKT